MWQRRERGGRKWMRGGEFRKKRSENGRKRDEEKGRARDQGRMRREE